MEAPIYSTPTMLQLADLEVLVVIFTLHGSHLKVLLQSAEMDGHENQWALPGQSIPTNCGLESAATQCIEKNTGLTEVYTEQLYTYGDLHRRPQAPLVSVVYFSLVASDALNRFSPKTNQTQWFAVNDLPKMILDHQDILEYALRRLRYKLEYTAVGFELLPESFSLSELQHTYELILGEKLDKRNFRRRILEAGIIEATPHRRMGEGRPAQLYRYRPDAVAEVKARRLFP